MGKLPPWPSKLSLSKRRNLSKLTIQNKPQLHVYSVSTCGAPPPPPPRRWASLRLDLLDFPTEEIARQITIIEHALFTAVTQEDVVAYAQRGGGAGALSERAIPPA